VVLAARTAFPTGRVARRSPRGAQRSFPGGRWRSPADIHDGESAGGWRGRRCRVRPGRPRSLHKRVAIYAVDPPGPTPDWTRIRAHGDHAVAALRLTRLFHSRRCRSPKNGWAGGGWRGEGGVGVGGCGWGGGAWGGGGGGGAQRGIGLVVFVPTPKRVMINPAGAAPTPGGFRRVQDGQGGAARTGQRPGQRAWPGRGSGSLGRARPHLGRLR